VSGSNMSLQNIVYTMHAMEQMLERGATREEVEIAISQGEMSLAKKGRISFRYDFLFDSERGDRHYEMKQVVPVVVEEGEDTVVITVYVFYF